MAKFEVGQWVVVPWGVCKIIEIATTVMGEELIFVDYGGKGRYVSDDSLRQALNIDYIHTLPTKQMAKFIWDVEGHCDFCSYGYKATGGECKYTGKCTDGIVEWLQKPYDGWEVEE